MTYLLTFILVLLLNKYEYYLNVLCEDFSQEPKRGSNSYLIWNSSVTARLPGTLLLWEEMVKHYLPHVFGYAGNIVRNK